MPILSKSVVQQRNNIAYLFVALISMSLYRWLFLDYLIKTASKERDGCSRGRLASCRHFSRIFLSHGPPKSHRSKSHTAASTSESFLVCDSRKSNGDLITSTIRDKIRTKSRFGRDDSRICILSSPRPRATCVSKNTRTFHLSSHTECTHECIHVFPFRAESTVTSRRCQTSERASEQTATPSPHDLSRADSDRRLTTSRGLCSVAVSCLARASLSALSLSIALAVDALSS